MSTTHGSRVLSTLVLVDLDVLDGFALIILDAFNSPERCACIDLEFMLGGIIQEAALQMIRIKIANVSLQFMLNSQRRMCDSVYEGSVMF
jgi:hypothetical protein